MNALSGYKTYLTAAAGVLTNVAMYANGQETLPVAANAIILLLVGVFIRHGVSTSGQ